LQHSANLAIAFITASAWTTPMANHPVEPTDPALAADWITIWQSERAAIAIDREVLEISQRMTAQWAAQAQAALIRLAADAADRCARPISPPRTPAAADAPDARIDGQVAGRVPGSATDPTGP